MKAKELMTKDYSISIYLDTRRAKATGKFPLKLRVFTTSPRKQKLYPTNFEFTGKEFEQVWNSQKPRSEHKELKREIQAIETKAFDTAKLIKPFTIEQFEKLLYRKEGDGIKVKHHYKELITELLKREQIGTADTYSLSEKSIIDFLKNCKKRNYDKLTLFDITPEWLKDFEQYSVKVKGRSLTTVSMYLRVLRTIFNRAISDKEIEQDFYPFGKRKYQPPATKNVKKSLSKDQLKTLFNSLPQTADQQKAKDFWFLSYACNGMNFKDIALLTFRDIQDGKIEFIRAKTALTSKANQKAITVYLNDFVNDIIKTYGNENQSPDNLIFDIITKGLTPIQKQTKIKNFIRYVNQHLKSLCKANDLPGEISTYWARHSFATNAVRNGASMEFIQESLGHGNLKTTQNYFAGFDSETKREFAETIMNFD